MEPVVGIFPSNRAAQQAMHELHASGLVLGRVELLLPGTEVSDAESVSTEDAEQPGVGQAVGGVVGAATGASAGFGLGAVTASLLIPGIGAVSAVGLAAAALLGMVGAVGGAAAGGALEQQSRTGLPKDEIYLYENALARGKCVLFAMVESDEEADAVRGILGAAGAESLDAARKDWWVGIREAESTAGATTGAPGLAETDYGRGFLAALQPDLDGKSSSEALAALQQRAGEVALSEAFQKGYSRGAAAAKARAEELGAAEPK